MLYSRAGDDPPGQPIIYAEAFSPNTPEGACPECHGHGRIYTAAEQSMAPDPSLTIRERAAERDAAGKALLPSRRRASGRSSGAQLPSSSKFRR